MKRRLLSLLFGLILVISLAACGSTQEAAPAEEETAEAVTEAEAAEPEESETEEAEDAADAENGADASAAVSIDGNTITITGSETGEESHENGTDKVPVFSCFDVGYSTQTGPIVFSINKIQVSSISTNDENTAEMLGIPAGQEATMVALEVAAENTSEDDIGFHPDQGVIVTNTKEQITAALFLSDQVGGDFYGQVEKDGIVYFFCPKSSAEEVTHIQLRIDPPYDESLNSCGDPVMVDFELIK